MKLFKCGKLYNGIDDKLYEDMEILVKGNRIVEVGKNINISDDVEIIDFSEYTVTPGMIDAHVHIDIMDWKSVNMDKIRYSKRWFTLAALHTAQKSMLRGFTTIRNVGAVGASYGVFEAKESIEKGYFEGARITGCANFIGSIGSHGDLSQYFRLNDDIVNSMVDLEPGIVNGVSGCIEAVRREWKAGAKLIKIMATGGFATPNDSPEEQQFTDEELKAIIKTAHDHGLPVTAHAYKNSFMKKLIEYGIDGIEHASFMDKDTAKLFEDKGVYLIPTFSPYDEIIFMNEENLNKKSPEFRTKLIKYGEKLKEGRKNIINSNIKLGFGSDFVAVHQAYESGYEYESQMNSGMNPFRILKAATKNNAEILGLKDLGTIEKGKLADISVWSRDLLKDPKALLNCEYVVKDGKIYKGEKIE